ncbi:MAG: sugar phosphate isomerase/epimerase [Clostridiales bacterium]|jgi:sugar phosphate isomerase/epimerase|nr:sugar phosphate isomerase/epimerase [Clostridiales bacterium]
MKTLPVALQLYSVRDFAEKDLEGTLKGVKEMGYDGVEFAGTHGAAPDRLKEMLAGFGLAAVSSHVPIAEIFENPAGAVEKYKSIGCGYIAIPYLPPELRPSGADFPKTLDAILKAGEICNDNGMRLLYHNHDFEFSKMPGGAFELDCLYTSVPADILQAELDVCWIKYAGQDPAAYIRKYAGRCPVIHLKDFYREGPSEGVYDLLGETEKDPEEKRGVFEFRPLGQGVQDFPPILEAAEVCGAEWLIVEQDLSVGRTSMDAARISREYLKRQGY